MRAYSIPTRLEVAKKLGLRLEDLPEDLVERAVGLVEEKLSISLKVVERSVFLDLADGIYQLPGFPVKGVKVEEAKGRVEVDEGLGILIAEVPKGTYLVSYRVGYEDGEIPAIVQLTLIAQMVELLGKEEEIPLGTYQRIWEEQVKKVQRRRDALKVS